MSSIDTAQQNKPDAWQPWYGSSKEQLKQAGLNLSDVQQRKIEKSLTRLSTALKKAGLNWIDNPYNTCNTDTNAHNNENFETYLATYR